MLPGNLLPAEMCAAVCSKDLRRSDPQLRRQYQQYLMPSITALPFGLESIDTSFRTQAVNHTSIMILEARGESPRHVLELCCLYACGYANLSVCSCLGV